MLNRLADQIHQTAIEKGFWDHLSYEWELNEEDVPYYSGDVQNPSIWPEKIALIHSEASEMLDALRSGDEPALAEECADLVIRLLDFTAARGIDIDAAIQAKMDKNKTRPHLHGRVF